MFALDKSALVLDSCAFVHLSNCSIRERSLIDFLIYDLKMNVHVSSVVHSEILKLLSMETSELITQADEIFKREVYVKKSIKIETPLKTCKKIITRDTIKVLQKFKKLKGSWLDKGEKDAAALALWASKKFNATFFVTGDFKAIRILNTIFSIQEIGHLQSPYDFCVYLYCKGLLNRDQVEKLLFSIEDSLSGFVTGDVSLNRIQRYRDRLANICNFSCTSKECMS